MGTVNVTIIHPSNSGSVDVGLPDDITLNDVFNQLIDENFLAPGQPYTGQLKPRGSRTESVILDNNKTINENGVDNNDTIQTLITPKAGGTVNVTIIHPSNSGSVDVGLPDDITLNDVFNQLIDENFLAPGQPYTGQLKPRGSRTESVILDNNKTINENGVDNNDTIQTLITPKAGGLFLILVNARKRKHQLA